MMLKSKCYLAASKEIFMYKSQGEECAENLFSVVIVPITNLYMVSNTL